MSDTPALGTLARVFLRIGLLSFGGPAAQIALLHRELVVARGWIGEQAFLDALAFCTLLPGPEAMQLATWTGWRLRGVPGGLIAGVLFLLPGAAAVLALAVAYGAAGTLPLAQAAFLGIKAAVVAIVLQALLRIGRRALARPDHRVIAGAAFLAMFALDLPFPAVLAAAALWGWAAARAVPGHPDAGAAFYERPAAGASLRLAVAGTLLWLAPLLAVALAGEAFLARLGGFFALLAVAGFGGAYAMLAYVAQTVVEGYGWVTPAELLDGLGLAGALPGPLILVVEFLAYLAGLRAGGPVLGLAAAALALWMTFVPAAVLVLTGAPWIARISSLPRLSGALAAVAAAVVGVILDLSVWFALQALFARVGTLEAGPLRLPVPEAATLEPLALAIALAAGLALFRFGQGLPRVLVLAATAGVAGCLAGL